MTSREKDEYLKLIEEQKRIIEEYKRLLEQEKAKQCNLNHYWPQYHYCGGCYWCRPHHPYWNHNLPNFFVGSSTATFTDATNTLNLTTTGNATITGIAGTGGSSSTYNCDFNQT